MAGESLFDDGVGVVMFALLLGVLLGVDVLLIDISRMLLWGGLAAIILTRAMRALTVGLPGGSWAVLTWGGLRGGIPVVLAFSMPAGPERDAVLTLTCCVVVFSILGQGLSCGRVVRTMSAKATDLPSEKRPPRGGFHASREHADDEGRTSA